MEHAAFAGVGLLILLMIFGVSAVFYFIPTLIAALRKHPQTLAIFFLNLLLGWSVLGWIGAFIWSLISPQPPTVIVQSIPPPPSA